ncbi:MAG TPA: metalloregulator ArsR/SmtB family transcription factor [Armatimonadota bacterium]|jgi:ArsR family transcriptional regulator
MEILKRVETEDRDGVFAVAAFKALGDRTRLRIFRFLCSCCCPVAVEETGDVRPMDGPTAGEVCCQVTGVEKITSTVSFHLKELRQAGLITMEKRGKHVVCGVNRDALSVLKAFWACIDRPKQGGCEREDG